MQQAKEESISVLAKQQQVVGLVVASVTLAVVHATSIMQTMQNAAR